jgi:protein-tyrosine-phosphatase
MKNVLFVCVENSCRSQMAEAFARKHGDGRVAAYSAGSKPSGRVNPRSVRFMAEAGCDLSDHRSKGLDEIPDLTYDFVATMGCGDACPMVRARCREDWNLPDPKHMDDDGFRGVRDAIEERVLRLLERLAEG